MDAKFLSAFGVFLFFSSIPQHIFKVPIIIIIVNNAPVMKWHNKSKKILTDATNCLAPAATLLLHCWLKIKLQLSQQQQMLETLHHQILQSFLKILFTGIFTPVQCLIRFSPTPPTKNKKKTANT